MKTGTIVSIKEGALVPGKPDLTVRLEDGSLARISTRAFSGDQEALQPFIDDIQKLKGQRVTLNAHESDVALAPQWQLALIGESDPDAANVFRDRGWTGDVRIRGDAIIGMKPSAP